MSKIVKIGWYDIQLKSVQSIIIDGIFYDKKKIERGTYYKLIRSNIKNMSYLHSKDHMSRFSWGKTGGSIKMYLKNANIHNAYGPALIFGKSDTKDYYIENTQYSYDNWLQLPEVKAAKREMKLQRILK
jgi:hypothetical protein